MDDAFVRHYEVPTQSGAEDGPPMDFYDAKVSFC
jgi:hypothetical protein